MYLSNILNQFVHIEFDLTIRVGIYLCTCLCNISEKFTLRIVLKSIVDTFLN